MQDSKRVFFAGLVLGIIAALLATGCSVQVNEGESDKKVDVRTPLGDVKVRTEVDVAETGMKVYPGARPLREGDEEPQSAHVNISSSLFGVKVVAAKFETDDAVDKVLQFYREEMKPYGKVVECRGNLNFKGRKSSGAVCKEERNKDEVQLAVGDEDQHRIISVKPKGSATEFAMVYVQTRGEQETL